MRLPAGDVRFGALLRELASLYDIIHGLGDIGRVIANALDVLGTKKHVTAKSDVARILHLTLQHACQLAVHKIDHALELKYDFDEELLG